MLLVLRRSVAIFTSIVFGTTSFVLLWIVLASWAPAQAHAARLAQASAQAQSAVSADTTMPSACLRLRPVPGQSDSGSTPDGIDWAASSGCLWGHVYVRGNPRSGVTVTLGYAVTETTRTIQIQTALMSMDGNGGVSEVVFVLSPDKIGARRGETGTLTATTLTSEGLKSVSQTVTFMPDPKTLAQQVNLAISDTVTFSKPQVVSMTVSPQIAVDGQTVQFTVGKVVTHTPAEKIVQYRWESDRGVDLSASSANFQYRALDLRPGLHEISVSVQDDYGLWSPKVTTTLEIRTSPTTTRQFALGEHHSCGLRGPIEQITGTVFCWGINEHGELGDVSFRNSDVPVAVIGMTNAMTIAAGGGSTCAIVSTGEVMCWGRNETGQLGTGNTLSSSRPVKVQGIGVGNAITLSVGTLGACAVTTAHEAWCWGQNLLSPTVKSTVPARVTGLEDEIVDIGVGVKHICALTAKQQVWCWGGDGIRPLLGSSTILTSDKPRMIGGIANATHLAVGGHLSCVVEETTDVKCWGRIGDDAKNNTLITPTVISGLKAGDIKEISVGKYGNVCVRYQNQGGNVRCWGYNGLGGLGDGTFNSRTTTESPALAPLWLRHDVGAMSLSGTGAHGCANSRMRGAVCWGANDYGQLGTAEGSQRNVPVDVIGLEKLLGLAVGNSHSCGVMSGTVSCWGYPGWKGDGPDALITGSNAIYSPTNFTSTFAGATALAIGNNQTCVLMNGAVNCLDNSMTPILGNRISEAMTGLDSGVTALTAGATHHCALKFGDVWCWGDNTFGESDPSSTMTKVTTPVKVTELPDKVKSVVAGLNFTCALGESGSVYCWGDESNGRLGNGTTAVTRPTKIPRLGNDVIAIAASHMHACAIMSDRRVKCWGWNASGQLGDGTLVERDDPVYVLGLTDVVSLALGTHHSCALLQSGRVKCWGDNQYGQLGDGSATHSPKPVTVVGLNGATFIASKWLHTCAIVEGGRAKCWGWDGHSQLGAGFRTLHAAPQSASLPDWTFMIYIAGDSDDLFAQLRAAANELDRLPESDRVNVVVQFVSNNKYVKLISGNEWLSDTVRWVVQPYMRHYNLGPAIWSMPPANSGDPQPLADFITWARANYPAKQFYLAIADHGRGTSGIAWTDAYSITQTDIQTTKTVSDYLTPAELQQALITGTQGSKLDILHLDACLMSMAEVAYQLKDVAHYMIASENLGWGTFRYREYVQALVDANGALGPRDFAVRIARAYFNDDDLKRDNLARTISVLDLDQAVPFATALNEFAVALSGTLSNTSTSLQNATHIRDARELSQKLDSQTYFTITDDDEYVDLFDFASHVSDKMADTRVSQAAAALTNVISSSLVVTEMHASGVYSDLGVLNNLSAAHGLAIYLPSSPSRTTDFNRYTRNKLFTLTADTVWGTFLVQYMNALGEQNGPDKAVERPDVPLPPCHYSGLLTVLCEKPTRAQLEQWDTSKLIDLIFALMNEVENQKDEK